MSSVCAALLGEQQRLTPLSYIVCREILCLAWSPWSQGMWVCLQRIPRTAKPWETQHQMSMRHSVGTDYWKKASHPQSLRPVVCMEHVAQNGSCTVFFISLLMHCIESHDVLKFFSKSILRKQMRDFLKTGLRKEESKKCLERHLEYAVSPLKRISASLLYFSSCVSYKLPGTNYASNASLST